jgi:outer membrane protein OmpA-like peptidoglycan-associated protein/tetratricopeptide (TPR) repeat protein
MKSLFILPAILLCSFCYAQSYDPDKVNVKALDTYDQAIVLLKDGMIKEAIPVLQECVALDSNFVDAILSLGAANGQLKKYQESVIFYEKAKAKDSLYFQVYKLPYAINLAGLGNFQKALEQVEEFLRIPKISDRSINAAKYRKKSFEFALDYQKKHPNQDLYHFNPVNLGDSVNSIYAEYYPTVTVSDNILVFTRAGIHMREDFMESNMTKKEFSFAKPIAGDINIEPKKGAITSSQDGEWILFAGQFSGQGFGNYDIYKSVYTPKGWSEPENLGANINTEFWESSPSLSPDNRVLFFSSNRPGGFGGKDLYISYRTGEGKWSPAKNIGPDINTKGDELAPFIHPDNQTLYYTSDGLPGYGGSDIYVLRKKSDGDWGIPENIGYPINTIENEGSLAVSADGLTAYYASDRADSRGDLDLYQFEMRPDIRPFRTLYVKGFVTDKQSGKGLPSSVELFDNENNKALMKVQTDEKGEYFITLPTGRDYTFTVNRKGYLFYSEQYALSKKDADSTYQKNIALQAVALNANFVFNNILFKNNSYDLPSAAFIELNKLLQVLNENPSIKLEISGHTDNVGKQEDNLLLSTNRAKAIVTYLNANGVESKRLSFKGYGASKPIADNNKEEGRSKNRRTEFTITSL